MSKQGKELKELRVAVVSAATFMNMTCEGRRKPRGIRITLQRLKQTGDVLRAARAIEGVYAKHGGKAGQKLLSEGDYASAHKDAVESVQNELQEMNKLTVILDKQLAAAASDPEKEEKHNLKADETARQIHERGITLDSASHNLAEALFTLVDNYPERDDRLSLFAHIAEKNNEAVMKAIDDTMRLTGKLSVQVADAPAYLKAMAENDTATIDTIMRRAFDRLP